MMPGAVKEVVVRTEALLVAGAAASAVDVPGRRGGVY